MASSLPSYEYGELPQDAFRYLTLNSGVGNDPLVCTLHTSRIDKADYEAISYVWGSEEQPDDIECDGMLLKTTSNLKDALRQVRLADSPRRLWADSVCINQKDLEEKGHQVKNMGQVYRSATCVLICVGSVGCEFGPGLRALLEDVNQMIYKTLYHNDIDYRSAVDQRLGPHHDDIFPYFDNDDPIRSDSRWPLLDALLSREWFQRAWVVREAGLARQALVLCGDTTLSWNDLMCMISWIHGRALGGISVAHEDRLQPHREAYEARHQELICVFYARSSWFECSLLDYMDFSRFLHLKDPRDRIYAFLDIAPGHKDGFEIIPNYTDTPFKIYYDFATAYILATKDLKILHYVQHGEVMIETGSTTWVPRWDDGLADTTIIFSPSQDPPLLSRTGQVSSPAILENHVFRVQGVVFDKVCFSSDVWTKNTLTLGYIFRVWIQVRALASSESPYRERLLAAFFDALTSGGGFYGDLETHMKQRRRCLDLFHSMSSHMDGNDTITWDSLDLREFGASSVLLMVAASLNRRRLIVTQRGYLGYAPHITLEGDLCAIVFGCSRPCLLRAAANENSYRLVGTSFVLGDDYDISEEGRLRFHATFGDENSKTWMDWDIEDQDIHLL
ncbi:HET-domain-containing protein [Didymella exigua CBS 183.55]|uniref:HET-domain-containing protein n=1 Tax=Didymella exigua CBS 183.55 TaxID=1150837 RepID=A0A6A5RS93_9PLEO|nr:HET-domain-containing protein [Didymella exigua CBS 183.55]KAF1929954.1 HET-domain-containing protein [Didymella exigua CBS 183.55]